MRTSTAALSILCALLELRPEVGQPARRDGSVAHTMKSVLMRQRLIRIGVWIALILTLAAWAVSLAVQARWAPWFTIVLWAAIGIGFVARIGTRSRKKRASLDAFHDLNQIYQGRPQTPYLYGAAAESSEVGRPFPDSESSKPRG